MIVTTATLGLLLVGVLAIAMTPDRSSSPEAVASTISGLRHETTSAVALGPSVLPLVTPVGDDGWAVTTMSALAGRSGRVTVRLPSSHEVEAEIITTDRATGLTVVSVPASAGYDLAVDEPTPTDTVLVQSDPPQTVTMTELASLDVAEATPVLDADGDLIGLCTWEADGVALRTVSTMPHDDRATTVPTTVRPVPSTTTATTVAPTTTPSGPTTASTSPTPTVHAPTTNVPTTVGTLPTTLAPTGPTSTVATSTPSAGGQVSDAGAPTTAPR